ncbi:type II toxin-antitoxin system RelE/ParE family toxin [Mucilaginibacter mali]|uniref:Type II toxin-antitoxin system RelE/ParE family toxin n=1 Tax=Mucilaginibacter mali TaxID=2740462 RepID=A0A7D4TV63_9SPHI|nr:type II toxin-antitoxin system RelE/ParE family toxin [Mucilaginibacter mali]QKJ28297.1 type II toxin-antitoxin system RelE/ParE family toxin [Mucilaginibacter mali]
MRVVIEDEYLVRLYLNGKSLGKPKFNYDIEKGFIKKVLQIENATNTQDLRNIKSLHFEKLSGDLEGKYSIRINKGYRIIFRIEREGNNTRVEIVCIEELSNHYS